MCQELLHISIQPELVAVLLLIARMILSAIKTLDRPQRKRLKEPMARSPNTTTVLIAVCIKQRNRRITKDVDDYIIMVEVIFPPEKQNPTA